jgi:hypothetical protein
MALATNHHANEGERGGLWLALWEQTKSLFMLRAWWEAASFHGDRDCDRRTPRTNGSWASRAYEACTHESLSSMRPAPSPVRENRGISKKKARQYLSFSKNPPEADEARHQRANATQADEARRVTGEPTSLPRCGRRSPLAGATRTVNQ